jgi:hypothetical protein
LPQQAREKLDPGLLAKGHTVCHGDVVDKSEQFNHTGDGGPDQEQGFHESTFFARRQGNMGGAAVR